MTAYTSHDEVQTAMYNVLCPGGNVDPVLAGLGVTGVFDWQSVPQNQPYDYITIGDGYEIPQDTFDSAGFLYFPTMHIWSRQKNTKNPSLMINRANQFFNRQSLELESLKSVYSIIYRINWLDGGDGLTLHVAAQYQCYSSQT
jgi:hypothetical protein